jgi:segregation and condensation protein A
VAFDQAAPLGELTVRWTGSDEGDVDVEDEFDDVVQAAHDVVQAADGVVPATDETTTIDLTGQDGPRDPVD